MPAIVRACQPAESAGRLRAGHAGPGRQYGHAAAISEGQPGPGSTAAGIRAGRCLGRLGWRVRIFRKLFALSYRVLGCVLCAGLA